MSPVKLKKFISVASFLKLQVRVPSESEIIRDQWSQSFSVKTYFWRSPHEITNKAFIVCFARSFWCLARFTGSCSGSSTVCGRRRAGIENRYNSTIPGGCIHAARDRCRKCGQEHRDGKQRSS